MTPPEASATDPKGPGAGLHSAVLSCASTRTSPLLVSVLQKRADFLRAASARRQGAPAFLLQARERDVTETARPEAVRIGFTCSKKVGNSVARNRARRRLREIARMILPDLARPGWDYVLVGRPEATATRDFAALLEDLRLALSRVHSAPIRPQGSGHSRRGAKG